MAKKTPVKKSRRRLKRSVRRSLAAVLMITAIGVAAIPVPDNYAAPDIMLLAEDDDDKHNDLLDESYGYKPDEAKDLVQTGSTINLRKFKSADGKVTPALTWKDLGGDLQASYFVRDSGGGDYSLSWQFVYYMETNPRDRQQAGVVCEYNSALPAGEVVLPSYTNTKYFVVTQSDIDGYFDGKDPSGITMLLEEGYYPNEAISYSYNAWKVSHGTDAAPSFLKNYFGDQLENWAAGCAAYEADGEQGDPPDKFSKTPSDDLNDDQKVQYFTEHVSSFADRDVTLVRVHDERPGENGESGEGGTVFLAKYNGASSGGMLGNYYLDDLNFLVIDRSNHYMCAIGDQAFKEIDNVQNLEFSEDLGYIGDEAFMKSSLLTDVTLTNVAFIGNRAFMNCVNLATVNLGQGTNTVGKECFSGDRKIQSISFDVALRKVGYGAFYDCRNLTTVSFANGQACEIDDYAFYNCPALTSVSMENANIIKLGEGAFASDIGSQPMGFVLPRSLSESDGDGGIGNFLFAGRTALQYVVFPRDYGFVAPEIELPESMFHACANLQYVEFPVDPVNDPYVGGYVSYDSDLLFADVLNPDFYVKGPKYNQRGGTASPRRSTWNAETKVSKQVPYVYVENGLEYYEVSDGFYLLCINNEGMLTSCTLSPYPKSSGSWDGVLEIPAVVAGTRVVGFASGCFPDSELNEECTSLVISDDSISSIADGVFQAGGGDHNQDWMNLKKVYIGNSVTSIGNNAFRDCGKLVDVTFGSPSDHSALTIGDNAFTTRSSKLTFHGDIAVGYAPFKLAMDPETKITDDGIRICYKSPSPGFLTVMYNPITEMVTLLDYPKFEEIGSLLDEAHADDIANTPGVNSYQAWREYTLYLQYSGEDYDSWRDNFADVWKTASTPEEAYASYFYGPWVNKDFCSTFWDRYGSTSPGSSEDTSSTSPPPEEQGALGSLADWLFEPITAYAMTKEDPAPQAFYDHEHYDVVKAATGGYDSDWYPALDEEKLLVTGTKEIVIPEGVESIDVYGYVNNLTKDGERYSTAVNNLNVLTYLHDLNEGTDLRSRYMYEGGGKGKEIDGKEIPTYDEEEKLDIIPGLFSGYYEDGDAASPNQEEYPRGNDVITSVTMKSVKYLPDYAFDSCENLLWVDIGDCPDIGRAPFRGCDAMKSVTDNDYYTTYNGIIYSKNEDGSLTIEECLSGRGSGAVGTPIVNQYNDPNILLVSAIKLGAFEDCDYITKVDFGSNDTMGLLEIPEDCFRNCEGLTDVTLPMTVNDVGPGAFVGANRLINLTIYGKEVKISGDAFRNDKDNNGKDEKLPTTVNTYPDSAVERYVKEYGDKYLLSINEAGYLGEIWQVAFYDANYNLIEDLQKAEEEGGGPLENPQYVNDGEQLVKPEDPEDTDDWTFERWVGMNNVGINDRIHENASFYAQGYSNSGMVGGKYPVTFWDGVDGSQVGPIQYIDPGKDAIAPAHPVHTGYVEDGYSDTFTNVQSPKTIIMKYKAAATSGGGGGTSGGTTSAPTTSTTSNTSNTSNTSSRGSTSSSNNSTSSTTTSSSDGSTQALGMYVVTVINGSGSGAYQAGATVLIQANTPAAGSVFSKWVTESQGVSLASVSTSPTTFTMPANNVTITAEYTAAAATPTGTTGGTGGSSGNSGNGSTRVDITKPGISNKDLATANVNGSTDNFVVKITETDEATRAVQEALTNKYGTLDNILYYAMDISLYDSTGTVKITDTSGLTIDITIPIPDALVAYGGNNMAGAVVNGNQLESLNENFTTINGVPCIRFTATHFSPYTIYVDTGNLTEGMLDTTPKTGDPIHPKWFLSIGLASLSIILFLKKDKKVKVKTA